MSVRTDSRWKTALKLVGINLGIWLVLELGCFLVLLGLDSGPPAEAPRGEDGWLRQVQGGFKSRLYAWDDHCLWRLRPGYRGSEAGGTRFWGGQPLTTNRHGMRGPDIDQTKPSGTRRILIIGGSHPMGMYVPYASTYGARLEARLNAPRATPAGGRWQVLNAAVPGHTSFQALRWLQEYGLAFGPDIVIADVGVNDTLPLSAAFPLPDHEVEHPPDWARQTRSLLEISAVYRLLRRALRRTPEVSPGSVRVDADHHASNLDDVGELGERRGFAVLNLGQFRVDTHGSGRVDCLYDERHRSHAVDLCRLWAERGFGARAFFADPIHANAEGHRVIADAIYERLARLGWLSSP